MSNSNDIIKYAASNDATFKFSGPVEIVGIGAQSEAAKAAGLQITLTPLVDSVKALDKSALASVGAGALGGVVGGPLGAIAAAGATLLYQACKPGEEPKHNIGEKAKPASGVKGWSIF